MQTPSTLESDPVKVAKTLGNADVWILPQPKEVRVVDGRFDLKRCLGIRLVGCSDTRLSVDFPNLLKTSCGIKLNVIPGKNEARVISLEFARWAGYLRASRLSRPLM